MIRLFALFLVLLSVGCTRNGNFYGLKDKNKIFSKPEAPELQQQLYTYFIEDTYSSRVPTFEKDFDLILSIDDSGSMSPYIQGVYDNVGVLLQGLIAGGMRFRISMVSNASLYSGSSIDPAGPHKIIESHDPQMEPKVKTNLDEFLKLHGYGYEQPAKSLALTAEEPTFFRSQFFRAGKPKIFITLSDAVDTELDDSDSTVASLAKRISAAFGADPWRYFAIGFVSAETSTGVEYYSELLRKLAKATGGDLYDILEPDYSKHLIKAVGEIDKFLSSISFIKHKGFDQVTVSQVKVNGTVLDPAAYSLDTVSNLVFNPGQIPKAGDQIDISYGLTFHQAPALTPLPTPTPPGSNPEWVRSISRCVATSSAVVGRVPAFPAPLGQARSEIWESTRGQVFVVNKNQIYDLARAKFILSRDPAAELINIYEPETFDYVLFFFRAPQGVEIHKLDFATGAAELLLDQTFSFQHDGYVIKSSAFDVVVDTYNSPESFLLLSNFHVLKLKLADILARNWAPEVASSLPPATAPWNSFETVALLPLFDTVTVLGTDIVNGAFLGWFWNGHRIPLTAPLSFQPERNVTMVHRYQVFKRRMIRDSMDPPNKMARVLKAKADDSYWFWTGPYSVDTDPSVPSVDAQSVGSDWDLDSGGRLTNWQNITRNCLAVESGVVSFVVQRGTNFNSLLTVLKDSGDVVKLGVNY